VCKAGGAVAGTSKGSLNADVKVEEFKVVEEVQVDGEVTVDANVEDVRASLADKAMGVMGEGTAVRAGCASVGEGRGWAGGERERGRR
jgi:hypothetical protein